MMQNSCHISLLTNGQDQILTIPHEFALPGTEVLLRKEGHRLIVEPVTDRSLLEVLKNLPDLSDNFPDVDEGLLPLDEVAFHADSNDLS